MAARGRTGAMREDAALTALKQKLSVPGDAGPLTDGFLLRFLRATNLDLEQTITKLRSRRKFERTFLALSSSPYLVRALRSGAFAIIGNDINGSPVLYVRMQCHYPSEDPLENEKLALVLLEYMSRLAFLGGVNEITILVNEENAGWFAHHNNLLQDVISSLVSNYYPEFIASVLVTNAAWNIARGVKTTIGNRAKGRIHVLWKPDLQKFVDSAVVPQELGGRNRVGMALQEFSEAVMQHWYATTSCIHAEREGVARPLYQQLPAVTTLSHQQQVSRRELISRGSRGVPRTLGSRGSRSNSSFQGGGGGGSQQGGASTGMDSTDDGVCSVISDGEFGAFGDEDDEDRDEDLDSNEGGVVTERRDLSTQLEQERRQRMKLEHEVQKLRLGVAIDENNMAPLESRLREIHEEVNILVGESILKAKKHASPSEPTLGALLEIVDATILHEIQERQHVPAMHFAQPTQRKPKGSCDIM